MDAIRGGAAEPVPIAHSVQAVGDACVDLMDAMEPKLRSLVPRLLLFGNLLAGKSVICDERPAHRVSLLNGQACMKLAARARVTMLICCRIAEKLRKAALMLRFGVACPGWLPS